MTSTDLKNRDYSQFWSDSVIFHIISTCVYLSIFWSSYLYHYELKATPKNCLLVSTNVISIVHSFISVSGASIAFFYDELYKIENMVISEPGLLAYVWVVWMSYMLADLISQHILYFYYDTKTIKRRYDIIAHHVVSYALCPIMNIPLPIYGWFILLWPPMTETSSIFLNLQWFGKYYEWSASKQQCVKTWFYITWFTIRLPAIITMFSWLIPFWNDMVSLWPVHVIIASVGAGSVIVSLHCIWTTRIVTGICKAKDGKPILQVPGGSETEPLHDIPTKDVQYTPTA
eukprot:383263_1